MSARTIAVIDVGTQSTNLLVTAPDGTTMLRKVASTRLGEGLHESTRLSDAAMDRTIAAVSSHAQEGRSLGADHIVVVGTAACRRASNADVFVGRVLSEAGVSLEVLSERDEAALSFTGALTDLPEIVGPTLVIDIGGGSTEYAVGVLEPEMVASIPFGAVTSTASHISADPPPPEDLTNLIGAVADELEEIGRTMPAIISPARVVGVAGTIVTVAAVELGLADFDDSLLHGMRLDRDAAEDVFRTVATESLKERILNPGLPAGRGDIIVAGCCILVATMRRLHLDHLTVSTRGLLDGVARRERLGA